MRICLPRPFSLPFPFHALSESFSFRIVRIVRVFDLELSLLGEGIGGVFGGKRLEGGDLQEALRMVSSAIDEVQRVVIFIFSTRCLQQRRILPIPWPLSL